MFLAGLDPEFDKVRADVLRMDPFPGVKGAFAYVRREAQRQATMLAPPQVSDRSALLINKGNLGDRKCTHCGQKNHIRDACWRLIGYPEWYLEKRKKGSLKTGNASLASSSGNSSSTSYGNICDSQIQFSNSGIFHSAFSVSTISSNNTWIIDSGATDHMTFNSQNFSHRSPTETNNVSYADGTPTPVLGAGSIPLTPSLNLSSVLHVPTLSNNLLSISQITKSLNCVVTFWPSHCVFQDITTKETIGIGREKGGLYYFTADSVSSHPHRVVQVRADNESNIFLWHRRLGHCSFGYLKFLFPSLFKTIGHDNLQCETCVLSKHHRTVFPPSNGNKRSMPFSLIHSDVWGPSNIVSISGMRWFVTFIDDCTRMTWIFLLKNKSDVCDVFQNFYHMILTQFHKKIQVLRSDNGGEYLNHSVKTFCLKNGILHQTSCAHTPQQNGTAERKNRHLLEVARSLLLGMHMPKSFWGDAVLSAAYLINRMPSSALSFQTPLQSLSHYCDINSALHILPRVFGCVVYVHVHAPHRGKLDPRAVKCVFIGYSSSQKGYKCYHPPSRRVFVSQDVTFWEDEAYFTPETSLQGENSNYEEKSPKTDSGIPISLRGQSFERENLPSENKIPGSLTKKTEPPLKIYERQNKGKKKQGQSVLIQVVQPSSSPSPVRQSDSEVENAPEVTLEPSILSDDLSSENHIDPDPILSTRRYPSREHRPPVRFSFSPERLQADSKALYSITDYTSTHRLSETFKAFAHQLSSVSIPSKLQDALTDQNWVRAMDEEMKALQKNCTWEIVDLPQGKKAVGCRWVYTIKHKEDGSIERYKARLVAKGYTQTYGVDYQETFAPVAKLNTVRVLISLAANLEWPLKQFDVKNAFLHGELNEEVYMDLPPGFDSKTGKVCRLKKALYGLKQSPRAWFGRLSTSMRKFGYQQSNSDHTLFFKHKGGKITILIVYVDDMIVTGNDDLEMTNLQRHLATEFEMKDLGVLRYFLGIEVARSKHGIFLSQRKYVLDLLTETGMLASKPTDTPMDQNHKLCECPDHPDRTPANKERYQRLVGKLIYLSHTRPDIAYAVSVVSQFMHAPTESHMDAVLRILRYLKGAPGRGLMFSKNEHLDIEGYTDADWAGNASDRRSTSGYFTFVGGNLVTWRSKKQTVVSRSSAEAEFRGIAQGITELLWLKNLLSDLRFHQRDCMRLYCDNKASVQIANNPVQHDRTKHVEIDRFFIKEKLEEKIIELPFVPSKDQLADILTKAINGKSFHDSISKLGMSDIYAPT
ncbi:hypothetical protein ACOSQ3_031278 [Xanthoceras sorbifolium]